MRSKRVLWVAAMLLLAVSLSGCYAARMVTAPIVVNGSGSVITETRDVGTFTSVELNAVGQMNISQGSANSLTITADDNLLKLIKTTVRNGVLVIEFERPAVTFNAITRLQYDITVTKLDTLTVNGAGDIRVTGLDGQSLKVRINGASNIDAAGKVVSQQVTLTGAGRYQAADLQSDDAVIEINGAGTAVVWAEKTLDVGISGMGNVEYYGAPRVSKRISGVGSVTGKGSRQTGS